MKMFSFGSKLKNKLSATRFEFSFVIHNLQPWPAGNRAIAIGYQRGKRRRGATRSVYTSTAPGRLGSVVRFNERFEMPVTLYKTGSGSSVSNGGLGPFKKKCLILAVLETDGRTQATAALGRVVIDLSEFAAVEHQETRTFLVSCNKAIHAAVGEPQLMVTIRCRWRNAASAGGNGQGLPDETGSMSTDTTGSRMTANLSSFLRFKFTGKGPANEEQDLRGFDKMAGYAGSVQGDKYMDTIQESHDEPDAPPQSLTPTGSQLTPNSSRQLTPTNSGLPGGPSGPLVTPTQSRGAINTGGAGVVSRPLAGGVVDEYGMLRDSEGGIGPMGAMAMNHRAGAAATPPPAQQQQQQQQQLHQQLQQDGSYGGAGGSGLDQGMQGMSLREQYAHQQAQAARERQAAAVAAAAVAAVPSPAPVQVAQAVPSQAPASAIPDRMHSGDSNILNTPLSSVGGARLPDPATPTDRSRRSLASIPDMGSESDLLRTLRAELLTCAALDAALHLALPVSTSMATGHHNGSRVSASGAAAAPYNALRGAHAPARRLARTLVCKGQQDGVAFGNCALRVLRSIVESPEDGLSGLAYWWANVVHLRAMLQGLGGAAASGVLLQSGSGSNVHWAASAFVPQLSILEREIFDKILARLWDGVLLPTVTGGAAKSAPSKALPVTKRAMQEAAIKRWFEGLEAVAGALGRLGSGGHTQLLRQQVLLQCLKKLDALMFFYLLGGEQHPDILSDYDPHGMLWGPGKGVPPLDDASLPFSKGVLTFGGGMSVKMTVTRLQQWAMAEGALAELGIVGSAGGAPISAAAVAAQQASGMVSGPLFPLLRAAADLLMMPKELLLDRAIRLDVCSALSMRSVIHILERFQPDEFAQDTINASILESLREESAVPITMRSPAAVAAGYRPPPDGIVLGGVEAGLEPGLEYDGDSEDELDVMASMTGGAIGSAASRFKLLHDLWASGVPRRRAAPAAHLQQQ